MTMSATPREGKSLPDEQAENKDRRVTDRRQKYNNGYTYISMVGWICRREKKRRNPVLQDEAYEGGASEKGDASEKGKNRKPRGKS